MTYKEILLEIHARHGQLTPEIVREEARPEESPLHGYVFNKDLGAAAEEYYLSRSHDLIQSVRVTVTQDTGERSSIRAFLAVPSIDHYVYEPVANVLSDREKFSFVLLEAVQRVRDAHKAIDDLDTLARGTELADLTRRAKAALCTARHELEQVT